jgi:hypothetical protein
MQPRRTDIDFTDHELTIVETKDVLIYKLQKPNTSIDSITYINTQGIMAVTGDYSNWIFDREFHPNKNGYVESMYWNQKLKRSSCQEPASFDPEATEAAIKEMLADEDQNWNTEDLEYLNELLKLAAEGNELDYTYYAFREMPSGWSGESVPFVKTATYHLLAIFDGFDEICKRLKDMDHLKSSMFGEVFREDISIQNHSKKPLLGKGVYLEGKLIGYVTKHQQDQSMSNYDKLECHLKKGYEDRFIEELNKHLTEAKLYFGPFDSDKFIVTENNEPTN